MGDQTAKLVSIDDWPNYLCMENIEINTNLFAELETFFLVMPLILSDIDNTIE